MRLKLTNEQIIIFEYLKKRVEEVNKTLEAVAKEQQRLDQEIQMFLNKAGTDLKIDNSKTWKFMADTYELVCEEDNGMENRSECSDTNSVS